MIGFFDVTLNAGENAVIMLDHIYISHLEFVVYNIATKNLIFAQKVGLAAPIEGSEIESTGFAVQLPSSLKSGVYRVGLIAGSVLNFV